MKRLLERAEAEIVVKKSRFIAIAYPIERIEEAKEKVRETRLLNPKASHVVHAAATGKDGLIQSYSDDKEPKNTAGRPAMEVLKGSGITGTCICIVRYFGGTLLGTGGLVKAYGNAAKAVLAVARTAEDEERLSFVIKAEHADAERIARAMALLGAECSSMNSGDGIEIEGKVSKERAPLFEKGVADSSSGRARLVWRP